VSIYEKAVFGSLCDNIEAVFEVCHSWHDHLWACLNAYTLVQLEQALNVDSFGKESFANTNPDHYSSEARTLLRFPHVDAALDFLDSSTKDPLQSDLRNKYHLIQNYIIRNNISQLFATIASWIPDRASSTPLYVSTTWLLGSSTIKQQARMGKGVGGFTLLLDACMDWCRSAACSPQLIRFAVHLFVYYRDSANRSQDISQQDAITIIQAYICYLIETNKYNVCNALCCVLRLAGSPHDSCLYVCVCALLAQYEFVALYTSLLPDLELQQSTFAQFLANKHKTSSNTKIQETIDQRLWLTASDAGLDMQRITELTVQLIAHVCLCVRTEML
jgi:hypothetical protein